MKLTNEEKTYGLTTQRNRSSCIRTFASPCAGLPFLHFPSFPARGKYSMFLSSYMTCVCIPKQYVARFYLMEDYKKHPSYIALCLHIFSLSILCLRFSHAVVCGIGLFSWLVSMP